MCIIDVGKRYQTIDNFGASDCWTIQYVGRWPDAKRNAIADLLFSTGTDRTGKPLGIGLSLWRFNIGAGSAASGADTRIADEWRSAECFQNPDGSYDWSRQAGQQWFLKAANERGVRQFLGFANSPPVQMTQNGLAYNRGRDATFNLKPDRYEAYADFLAHVVMGVEKSSGVRLGYLSPFNEPEWDWQANTQEGTPALNAEIAREVRALDAKLSDYGLDTRIVVTESGKLDYLYKGRTDKPGRDNQVSDLFGPSSADSIGGLVHVAPLIAGHAYWTVNPVGTMVGARQELHRALQKARLKYWQTEVCLLEQVPGVGGGNGRDLTMKTALFFARLIHTDMVVADAAAWQWWLGVSNSDYKDGLVYVFSDGSKLDGSFTDSKLLWAVGNFSRFVRPGAVRVDVSSPDMDVDDPMGLMVSAYAGPDSGQVVAVAVNYGDNGKRVAFSLPGLHVRSKASYTTSDDPGDDLAPGGAPAKSLDDLLKPRSVTTFVFACDQSE
jgi:O-glycosyl hydrolase